MNAPAKKIVLPPLSELFPGLLKPRAEYYAAQLQFVEMLEGPGFWWSDHIGPRAKVFLCRVARVNRAAVAEPWGAIPEADRVRLVAAFMWLFDWVNSIPPPLQPYLEKVFDDE